MVHSGDAPSQWVCRFAPIIPDGLILDLACGSGRHARWLVQQGRSVLAVDRDLAALDQLTGSAIEARQIDLEAGSGAADLLQSHSFAGIVVTNYLHRPLLPALFDSLIEGGVLIYETFAAGNAAFGKPSSPAFLLQSGELLTAAAHAPCGLHVLAFEDGYSALPKPAMVQRLCAIRTGGAAPATALQL